MSAKIAKAKVWKTADNKLVPDGHNDAVQLVARRGESIPDEQLAKLHGVDEFFAELNSQEATEAMKPQPPAPKKAMSREEIENYRNKHKDEHPYTGEKYKQPVQDEPSTRPKNRAREAR